MHALSSAALTLMVAIGLAAGSALAQRLGTGAGAMASPAPVQALPSRRGPHLLKAPPFTAAAPAPRRTQAETAAATPSPDEKTYILGPSDVVEVSVLGRTDYTTRTRIDENGDIQLQYLGTVKAAGRTTEQLSAQIAEALKKGGFFANPVVQVNISSYASRYVTVLGNVTTPGLVPVDRAYRLSEIIARVGGIKESRRHLRCPPSQGGRGAAHHNFHAGDR